MNHEERVREFLRQSKEQDRRTYDQILQKHPVQNEKRKKETNEYEVPSGLIKSAPSEEGGVPFL
jgi:hypothetical protein